MHLCAFVKGEWNCAINDTVPLDGLGAAVANDKCRFSTWTLSDVTCLWNRKSYKLPWGPELQRVHLSDTLPRSPLPPHATLFVFSRSLSRFAGCPWSSICTSDRAVSNYEFDKGVWHLCFWCSGTRGRVSMCVCVCEWVCACAVESTIDTLCPFQTVCCISRMIITGQLQLVWSRPSFGRVIQKDSSPLLLPSFSPAAYI